MTSSSTWPLFFIFLLLTLHLTASNDLEQDRQALLAFMDKVKQAPRINWYEEKDTCKWTGVVCEKTVEPFRVSNLRLPGQGLKGQIPYGTLGKLSELTILSLRINLLSGPLPGDFANLRSLKYVYLQNNSFTGPLSIVTNWTYLQQLDVSLNKFTGRIPYDIDSLKELERLKLHNNELEDWLPEYIPSKIDQDNFTVSNNNLIGTIPPSLASKYPTHAFFGNIYLCGEPLSRPCNVTLQRPPSPPRATNATTEKEEKKKKLSTGEIVAIAIGSTLIILVLLICLGKNLSQVVKKKKDAAKAGKGFGGEFEAGTSSSKDDVVLENKWVFFEGGDYSFDLEDLLRASAELLGKGSVGKSYRTVLKEDLMVVVKQLKDVDVSRNKFDDVMEGLGKMKNENVVPIRAYYYSKHLKWLVSDYFPDGSLSALLHGSRGSGWAPLNWDHRFKIALSAAEGVAYLHVTGKVVHGNIKSSNILLRQDSNKDAFVSDFGLNTLFGGSSSPNTLVTGYRAPEVLKTQKVTFESDVYSFGVLLLELLTGKAPNKASLGEEGTDLPKWANSRIQEEWTEREEWKAEVFDAELMRDQNIEEEMVQLLQIAMKCVSTDPGERPAMQAVVRMIKDMNRAETDDGIV